MQLQGENLKGHTTDKVEKDFLNIPMLDRIRTHDPWLRDK